MNEFLRKECKTLKAFQGVAYKEIADYLEIKQNSFYSWLNGQYDLSTQKQTQLKEIISILKE